GDSSAADLPPGIEKDLVQGKPVIHGGSHVPIAGKQPVLPPKCGDRSDLAGFLPGHRRVESQPALPVQLDRPLVKDAEPQHPPVQVLQFLVRQLRNLLTRVELAFFVQNLYHVEGLLQFDSHKASLLSKSSCGNPMEKANSTLLRIPYIGIRHSLSPHFCGSFLAHNNDT